MYFPYFRGKQNELAAIRETAAILARSDITPIIEPVKSQLNPLRKTLDAIRDENGAAVVIMNPKVGDLAGDGRSITALLDTNYAAYPRISVGIMLTNWMTTADAIKLYAAHQAHFPVFIHAGFLDAQALAAALGSELPHSRHVFFEKTSAAHLQFFSAGHRVLLKDGLVKRKNADYPPVESFADIHLNFQRQGMNGFGDFLTVGDEFSETGGPAYAVAIHLTFIDPSRADEMMIYHFVSDRVDTPDDAAGKFGEALAKLVVKYRSGNSHLIHGRAMTEFLSLHARGHYPGLGVVKKLSMIHHIETYEHFL